MATDVGPAPFIDSTTASLPGANATEVALCCPGTLDPAVVTGKIVCCDRGVISRVDKSLAVQMAGGVGMVMANTSASSLNADFHFVPSVHVSHLDRPAMKAYAAKPGATATINQSTIVYNVPAPFTASFSSRGPLLAGGGDLLKPDLIAPGQDILAAVAPPGNNGKSYDLYSGTSMSSPHVAGLAALMKEKHPSWSPMAIKSALMTTGTDLLDGGTPAPNTNPVLIFRQGAGHVQPNSAMDPGLVYDSGFNDWLALICATQPQGLDATCNALWSASYSKDAIDLNQASIAIGDMAGTQTVKRRVKNVSGKRLNVDAVVTGMTGFTTVVSPASLILAPGQEGSFTVAFTRTSAPLNAYTGGQLTWIGDGYSARSPIVVRSVALAAPNEVSGSYSVTFGYTGGFTASARGLVPAAVTAGTVDQDPDQTFDPADSTGTVAVQVVVPAGTTHARFSLFDTDVAPGSDIDMFVFREDGTFVGQSAAGGSDEAVDLVNPQASTYIVFIHGWGLPAGTSPFKLHAWVLGAAAAGNMTVTAPASATTGGTGAITISTSDLVSGTKYLGSVAYGGASGLPNPTIVRIDQP